MPEFANETTGGTAHEHIDEQDHELHTGCFQSISRSDDSAKELVTPLPPLLLPVVSFVKTMTDHSHNDDEEPMDAEESTRCEGCQGNKDDSTASETSSHCCPSTNTNVTGVCEISEKDHSRDITEKVTTDKESGSDSSRSEEIQPAVNRASTPVDRDFDEGDALDFPILGTPIDIVFSFDTTGSMSSCLDEVRSKVGYIIERLFMDIPALKISVLAHGDYCDSTWFYVTQQIDFTNDVRALCEFVNSASQTGGGDWEECYELALRKIRQTLTWTPGSRRALVMIGDSVPHDVDYPMNTDKIDWRQEIDQLYQEMGVRAYSVQCQNNSEATPFWLELAHRSNGKHLKLQQFSTIIDMVMAICYREQGPQSLQAYEMEVRRREGFGIRNELTDMFDALRQTEDANLGTSTNESSVIMLATPPSGKATPSSKVPHRMKSEKKKRQRVASGLKKGRLAASTPRASKVATAVISRKMGAKAEGVRALTTTLTDAKAAHSKRLATKRKEKSRNTPNKCIRENVPHSRFTMNHLSWSPWHLAMAYTHPKKEKHLWLPRRQGHIGDRKIRLFRDTSAPAVYEIAVQPKKGCKKFVMHVCATGGFESAGQWDAYLLRQGHVVHQIDDVIRQGCNVFLRRAVVSKNVKYSGTIIKNALEVKRHLLKVYDYAWRLHQNSKHRSVQRRGFVLSRENVSELFA